MPVRVFCASLALLLGCGHPARTAPQSAASPPQATPAADDTPLTGVGVAVRVVPADATVEIDEQSFAAAQLPRVQPLEPGIHTLVVTRESYKPYRIEFSVTDKVETFDVRLELAR